MLIDRILSHPLVFDWQQRLCNHYENVRDHFREYLDVADKDILEIGCSTGACAKVAVPMGRNRYVGIDIVPEYVALAAKRCPAGKFLAMDARSLAFPDASFDVVLFVGALHHMDNGVVRDCFREIGRVLRPGGVVLCGEPVFTKGKALSTFFLNHDRGKYIRDEEGYRGLFDGFEVLRQDYFHFAVHRFCSFVLRKRGEAPSGGRGRVSASEVNH